MSLSDRIRSYLLVTPSLAKPALFLFGTLLLAHGSAGAQDLTNLGGDMTSGAPPSFALELPAPNMTSAERVQMHLEGHGFFHREFGGMGSGSKPILGPNFSHSSCGSCHVKDGRGPIRFSSNGQGSALLIKVSMKGLNKDGSNKPVPGVGEQLQDNTIGGKSRFKIKLNWKELPGTYPDGSKYSLRKPLLSFDIPKVDERKVVHSLRMSPPVIGMGLLEAVPAETISALSDPYDLNSDGISGKARVVTDRRTKQKMLGRFGFRANNTSVEMQTGAAAFNDMGVTNELFKNRGGAELNSDIFAKIVHYQQAAGIPPARDQNDPDVMAGKQLFQQVNCSACHVMTLETGDSNVPETAHQTIHPFTDLLLHDMGKGLSDGRIELGVSGREWRTTPLWGLGLYPLLSNAAPGFLHDGRARSIEEAILWHDGEAKASRDQFKALSAAARAQLLKFLNSL